MQVSGTVEVFTFPNQRLKHLWTWRIRSPAGKVCATCQVDFKNKFDAVNDCMWLHEVHGLDIYAITNTGKEKLT